MMLFAFLLVLHRVASLLAQLVPTSTDNALTEDRDNINVVLFLAHADMDTNYDGTGEIPYLNISAVGRIKPCTVRPETNLPRSFEKVILHSQRKECDCKKLLESSIFSLLGWARNANGMTAAVVSLISNEHVVEKENGVGYYNYKLQVVDTGAPKPRNQENPAYMEAHNKEDFGQLPLPLNRNFKNDDLPNLKKDSVATEHEMPIINAYPPEPKLRFNDIHKYHRKFDNFANVRRVKRKLIVEPENTQVFEIDATNEEPGEILKVPSLEKSGRPESVWDLLGLMSAIRKSFFVNFLNPMMDPHQRLLDEENGMHFDSLGQVRTPSLFHLVKTTLRRLQDDTKANRRNGFLLIVFGGSLLNISNPYSDLVQSIKHVRETTDAERTLVVVTGSCPKNHTHDKTHYEKKNKEEFLLPVYAKGPNAEVISKAKELFDIPLQIKEAIRGNRSKSSEKHKTDLETANKNAKFLNVNDNEFYNNWMESTALVHDDDNLMNQNKWASNKKKRSVLEILPRKRNNSMRLILHEFILILLFAFILTV